MRRGAERSDKWKVVRYARRRYTAFAAASLQPLLVANPVLSSLLSFSSLLAVVVPRSCLITVEMGRSTPIGQTISLANLDLDAPKHVYLMVFLLVDRKNPDSFFKPYYDILPPKLSNMPIFWNQEELGERGGGGRKGRSELIIRRAEKRRAKAGGTTTGVL